MFHTIRDNHNPLVSPHQNVAWRSIGTPNGVPIDLPDGTPAIVYRAIGAPDRIEHPNMTRSHIGIATSTDQETSFQAHKILVEPSEDFDRYGCEDPRVTCIEGRYYIFYTAISEYPYQADGIRVAVAVSDDLDTINEKHLVTPFNAKAMCLFPEKIDGKYTVILSIDTDTSHQERIALAQCEELSTLWDTDFWHKWYTDIESHTLSLTRNDSDHAEVGAVPIRTDAGWLMIYSHIEDYFSENKSFGIEAALVDANNPWEIIGRTSYPFLVPETTLERYGYVPNVVFPTGAAVDAEGMLALYYGAADTTTCRAYLPLDDLLQVVQSYCTVELFTRGQSNPILAPKGDGWESKNVFNPAAIYIEGVHYIVYRAQDAHNTSTMGLAVSHDGLTIDERFEEPIYIPRIGAEEKRITPDGFSGCEDPRITRIGDTLYVCYTAYNGVDVPRVAVSSISVSDFIDRKWDTWSEPVLMTPGSIDDKDACILPHKVDGSYFFIHRISHHICGQDMSDLDFTHAEINRCMEMMHPRAGMWDGVKIGIAGVPHYTRYGWLMLYHGVSVDSTYRVGAALLDLDDPTRVLARSTYPIFSPQEEYELVGDVPRVVFPCGSIIRDDTLYLYYGGADHVVGVATAPLDTILQSLGVED